MPSMLAQGILVLRAGTRRGYHCCRRRSLGPKYFAGGSRRVRGRGGEATPGALVWQGREEETEDAKKLKGEENGEEELEEEEDLEDEEDLGDAEEELDEEAEEEEGEGEEGEGEEDEEEEDAEDA